MSTIKVGTDDSAQAEVSTGASAKKYSVPKDSQILIYPMMECTVAAGFKNKKYAMDPQHKFTHYGVDFDERGASGFDVMASGNGVVLGVERNTNQVGGVVVIQYDKVFNPSTGKSISYVARYYHLQTITTRKGRKVKAYDVIGTVSGSHPWWNHVHMELDTDTKFPFYTPQVSESASRMLKRRGANGRTVVNPIDVLVIGKKQTAQIHPLAVYVDPAADTPKYYEKDFDIYEEPDFTGTQKLILPMKLMKVTCGYKNEAYYNEFKFNHYGMDVVNMRVDTKIYALGNGTVIAAGWDGVTDARKGAGAGCGYVLVIKYDNVQFSNGKKAADLICTYMHMDQMPLVKAGDKVEARTLVGDYGETGRYPTAPHLHIQFDTDTNWPLYCYGSGSEHKLLKKGTVDTTVDPLDVLWKGRGQSSYCGKYTNYFDSKKVLGLKSAF